MIDLRYHLVSLAAVFVFFVIGILTGVGLSGQGFVEDAERDRLNDQIERIASNRDAAEARVQALEARQEAGEEFVQRAYPVLVADRLAGIAVARVVIGDVDEAAQRVLDDVDATLADGGATALRLRAIRVPLDEDELTRLLATQPELAGYDARDLGELGGALAREFVDGGETPLWDALSPLIVAQRTGTMRQRADGVVVIRAARQQTGMTSDFVRGFYEGLDGVPAVGVERTDAEVSAVRSFRRADLSSVDDVDTRVGRLALALLLAGAGQGQYGVKPTATAALPAIEPLPVTTRG